MEQLVLAKLWLHDSGHLVVVVGVFNPLAGSFFREAKKARSEAERGVRLEKSERKRTVSRKERS